VTEGALVGPCRDLFGIRTSGRAISACRFLLLAPRAMHQLVHPASEDVFKILDVMAEPS